MGLVASDLGLCCSARENRVKSNESPELSPGGSADAQSAICEEVGSLLDGKATCSQVAAPDESPGDNRPAVSQAAHSQRPVRGPVTWAPSVTSPPRSPAEKQRGRRWVPCGKDGICSQPVPCAQGESPCRPVTMTGSGFFLPHGIMASMGMSLSETSAASDLGVVQGQGSSGAWPERRAVLNESPARSASTPSMSHGISGDQMVCRNGCCHAFRPGGEESKTDRLVRLMRKEKNQQTVNAFLRKNGFQGINESRRRTLRFSHWYPIHCAVASGDAAMVGLLLQLGADQRLQDGSGLNAYERALRLDKDKRGSYSEVVKALESEHRIRRIRSEFEMSTHKPEPALSRSRTRCRFE